MTGVVFCGYRVSANGLSPKSEKTAAIAKIQTPSSIKFYKSSTFQLRVRLRMRVVFVTLL